MAGEAERTAALLAAGGIPPRRDTEPGAGAPRELRRALCAAIRAGRFDEPAASAALMAHLTRTAADWVAISNPKALRSR